ncbi:uncharacterized protein LOC106132540 [Amyelois transitella]|uniref:uncharacterized protein LOC106132540 n=1 Tax=Amyelois transitella TaxID=680683 RepID=UPI00298F6E3E|nr:uncharacterized protein LOC106132540 [Amyelois transitella]
MAIALVFLLATVTAARLGDLARRDSGDVFTITGDSCGAAQCAEHGAGVHEPGACACACPQRAPLFREDRELCVDDLPECSLATFGTGSGVQKIPFVYLPLKGQIIHPSKEITFKDVKTPICAVSGAQFLTRKGFLDLRNTLDADVPFNLFRDEGRTFLQWSGEDDVRARMTGRVMVVRLLCRDVSATPASPLDLRGVFTPCVAFRVQGSPPKQASNITEVQFAPNAQTSEVVTSTGLSVTEYVAIGISSLLLGLIYVASVFLFLHIRKRRKAASENGGINRFKGLKKKDGSVITERDIIRINNERPLSKALGQDDGIIKKNPLLAITRQFHETKSFSCDSGSNISDSEDLAESSSRSEDHIYNSQVTSAVVHLHQEESKNQRDNSEISHRDESNIERLPDEHVSIVETTDDREITRPVGTTRRKLYFNPAYFEPHLMAEPPAAALEFLEKIREVIAIAKHKMASKRFQPVLNEIPEEETFPSAGNSMDIYQGLGSQRSGSLVSLKRENSRKKIGNCVGCPGCQSNNESGMHNFIKYDVRACTNCLHGKGDKQNSIRKWLENIPTTKTSLNNDLPQNSNHNNIINSLMSLPNNDRQRIRKQNSFSNTSSLYLRDNSSRRKKSSTMSVKSEPTRRNYNIPLPEFNMEDCQPDYNYFCKTVSRIENFRTANYGYYQSVSLRNSALANQRRNKYITNKNALPDMVNDTIALDECSKVYHQSSSDDERFNRNSDLIENRYTSRSSESPMCNDYETDSLERSTHQKRISTPTEYPDIPSSSQASPSLSNALPLEEELTMRNSIYKNSSSNSNTPSPQRDICIDQNHYEAIVKPNTIEPHADNDIKHNSDYSLVSEVYVNNNYNFGSAPTSPSGSECSMGSRKLVANINNNVEGKPGCLTIEVIDPPENYIKIHESDGFEPDTLDRKQLKHKEIEENLTTLHFCRSIDNLDTNYSQPGQAIQLRSSGTFTKIQEKVEYSKFNSLRNEFENKKNMIDRPKLSPSTFEKSKAEIETDDTLDVTEEWNTEEGRILTLELRHSKRQRQCTPPTIKQLKNLARPDILPPLPPTEDNPIYEQPIFPPKKVEVENILTDTPPKNVSGRSLSPRKYTKNATFESPFYVNSIEKEYGPSCSPLRASGHLTSSEYTNNPHCSSKLGNVSRNSSRRQSLKNSINTNTFVRGPAKEDQCKPRFRRRKGQSIEDSGYLSSDSTSSRQVQRKLVIPKIVSGSESDDTENEARSESGAESVETHSVYFGSYRKPQIDVENCFRQSSRKNKYT